MYKFKSRPDLNIKKKNKLTKNFKPFRKSKKKLDKRKSFIKSKNKTIAAENFLMNN